MIDLGVRDPAAGSTRWGFSGWWVWLLAICVLGATVRVVGLDKHEFRLDEVLSWYCAHHFFAWPADGPEFRLEMTSIPYFFLLSIWSKLFGESEAALRSLSVVFGSLTVPVLAWTGYRVAGHRTGLICAVLAAVSPLALWYAQLTRVYAMWTLLLALASFCLWCAAKSGRVRLWAAYGIVTWIALFTHYFTLFWIPCTVLVFLVGTNRRAVVRQWVTTHFIVGVAFVPILIWFALPVSSRGSGSWLVEYWGDRNPWLAVPMSLAAFLPAGDPPDFMHTFSWSLLALGDSGLGGLAAVAKWTAVPVIVVLCLGARRYRGENPRSEPSYEHYRVLVFWAGLAIGPLVLSWLYSVCVRPNYLVGRYDMMSWPAWIVAVSLLVEFGGRGLAGRRSRVACVALTSVLALVSATYAWGMFRVPSSGTIRERMDSLVEHSGERGWVVLVDDPWHLIYDLHRRGFEGELMTFPSVLDRQIGWRDVRAELAETELLQAEAEALAARTRRRLENGEDAWVVVRNYASEDDPTFEVDRILFAALNRAGIEIEIADPKWGLGRLLLGDG